ncbi:serine/threonine protein kinase [Caldibacillus thermoamylovorans]|uniref:serine/threonine protein kinase n=1 Tax=Caldibacillus thermoamylovorans TaxID=35841 RepID=UPI0022E6DA11|nr:protein kinase [Caldibacillus thermoamylovorans]
MMMNSMKSPFNFASGTIIQGKWHHNRYTIIRELGRGANGIVYLADWNGKKVAIKVSDNHVTITSEVNVLKSFTKAQGVSLGPSLFDVDDWIHNGSQISFYVMEYIAGTDLLTFIKQNGTTWLPVLISQLLTDLDYLHKNGWVFGDLKPENLLVTKSPVKIRCIDVGGTTMQGRAIKEFTEFFDRGYWGLGSRRAEPSYDLFAVAMIVINLFYPKRFQKHGVGIEQLKKAIQDVKELRQYRPILLKALAGKYSSATEMKKELLKLIHFPSAHHQTTPKYQTNKNQRAQTNNTRTKRKKQKNKHGILETILIVSIVCIIYAFYIFEQIM